MATFIEAGLKRKRRLYVAGRCDDGCMDAKRVTRVTFWLNGFQMNLCARCVRGYRKSLRKVVS